MYQISSGDLGAWIEVTVTPVDCGEEYTGTAEAKYGPVSLSLKLRQHLEYALAAGGSTFTLYLAPESVDMVQSRCEVRLQATREELILQVFDEKGRLDEGQSVRTGYTIDYPSISLHPFDTKRFHLTFKQQGAVKRLQLQSLTRQNRDLVVLTLRCLAARKYLLNSKTLQDLFTTEGNLQSQGGTVSSPLDLTLEIDRSIRELYALLKSNDDLTKERNQLKSELQETEADMQETLSSYQAILADAGVDSSLKAELDTAIDQKNALRGQLAERDAEIERLKGEAVQTTKEVERLRRKTDVAQLELVIADQNELISMLKSRQTHDDSLKSELASLQLKASGQAKLIQELTQQAEEARKERDRVREENAALLGQRGLMAKKIDVLGGELEAQEKQVDELMRLQEETRGRHELAIQKLLSEMEMMEREQPNAQAELERLQRENEQLKSQCDTLTGQLSRAQALARRNRSEVSG